MIKRTQYITVPILYATLAFLFLGLELVWPAAVETGQGLTPPPISQPGIHGRDRVVEGEPTYEQQVVILVNQRRWENGQLPPLKHRDLLDSSSELHSNNMATRNFFAHCDPDTNTQPWDRMVAAGYNWNGAAENIAAGYGDPAAVMVGWMNSSGHRANILSSSYREIGVGYVYQSGDQGNVREDDNNDCTPDSSNNGPYYRYWTQNFGRIDTVYPVVINREAYETGSRSVSLYVYGAGWAQEMRFSNNGGSWSAWEPYAPNKTWTLAAGTGQKTVYGEIRNGGTVRAANDTIWLNDVPLNLPPLSYLPQVVRP